MEWKNSEEFARALDDQDPLKAFRNRFYLPLHNGQETIYLTGNSLGLQPKSVSSYIQAELDDWARLGVEGHFQANQAWLPYHELFPGLLSPIVGAKESEIVVMNSLTVNLHMLMVSFYRPTRFRYKIICEGRAFPSDQYAFESQVKFHGYHPEDAIIELFPREGEFHLRTEDILAAVQEHADSLALVLMGGVNYYTGQYFDLQKITAAAHQAGALCGFDLAHAAGNVKLQLHDWNIDFACWCSYKYLNSGPGGVAGAFVHEKHHSNPDLHRFAGWWGYEKATRFQMEKGFKPIHSAEGWQLSNAPVLSMAAHKAALDIFAEAGMDALHDKREKLAAYLRFILEEINAKTVTPSMALITPADPESRGCQMSMLMLEKGRTIFDALTNKGVIADWREPNVIRVAPVPLYNSFADIWRLGQIIADILAS